MHFESVHPGPAERRQQRGVNVNHVLRERVDCFPRHQFQVPGEHHEVDFVPLENRGERVGICGVRDDVSGHLGGGGLFECAARRSVARNENDSGARAPLAGIHQGLQVRSAAGGEHRNTHYRSSLAPPRPRRPRI